MRSEREYVEYVHARMPWLRRLAYRLCGKWSAADDLVQECLVALYRHWRKASAAESVDAYVRAMLVLRYWEDLDVTQTAAALGCSTGTVKSQTSYAIAALRRLLPNYLSGGADTP